MVASAAMAVAWGRSVVIGTLAWSSLFVLFVVGGT
jgi:hypothetical protein